MRAAGTAVFADPIGHNVSRRSSNGLALLRVRVGSRGGGDGHSDQGRRRRRTRDTGDGNSHPHRRRLLACLVAVGTRDAQALGSVKMRPLAFLALSGMATAVSWLAYFRALQLGPASRVAPIDKLSLPITILLAALLLNESIGWKTLVGTGLMTIGALLTIA